MYPGALSLKAYRLSASFMNLFKEQEFTQAALLRTGVTFQEIVEEIPVRIHNLAIVRSLLHGT